ncbi:unnamed protein product [Urochloa humidicola]
MKQAAIHSHVKFQRKKVVGRAHAASSVVGKKLAKAAWVEWEREMLRVADERSEAPDGDLELELGVLHASRRGPRPPLSSQRQGGGGGGGGHPGRHAGRPALPFPNSGEVATRARQGRHAGRPADSGDGAGKGTLHLRELVKLWWWPRELRFPAVQAPELEGRWRRLALGRVGGGGARGCEESAGDACF